MLSTLGRLTRRLSVTDTSLYPLLLQLLIGADAWAKSYLGYNPEAADVTEYPEGGRHDLVLRRRRVTSLSGTSPDNPALDYGVWVDPSRLWGVDTALTLDTDYRLLDDGGSSILRRLRSTSGAWWGGCGQSWPAGDAYTRVIYRAGFEEDEIPADMSEAVEMIASYRYGTRSASGSGSGQVKSERLGQYQVAFFSPSELTATTSTSTTPKEIADAKELLSQYRDVRVW